MCVLLYQLRSVEHQTQALCGEPRRLEGDCLRSLLGSWRRVASHRGGSAEVARRALGLPVLFTDAGFDKREVAQCDAGISDWDVLVAQTGTVVVTTRIAGGRALSVLPPHHVVLTQRAQLVPDFPAAFKVLAAKYGAGHPSMISLITGPGRTGDIERILVLRAHGPKKLTIFCY
jgi:L-lactate dehydrogenase complex protein LldG